MVLDRPAAHIHHGTVLKAVRNYSDRQKIRKSSLGSYLHSWISDNGLDTPGAVDVVSR
jgi:hypothetical protein